MNGKFGKQFGFLWLLFLLQLVFTLSVSGQSIFGNEWIVAGQTYYKIPVGKTGMYAIPFNQLQSSGILLAPLGSVQPSELQLFHRGVEQAIYINNDSLFFYGEKNDGTLDSLLYEPHSIQPHKYYNLYSDTSAYFLTWKTGNAGKRMNLLNQAIPGLPLLYQYSDVLNIYNDRYELGYRHGLSTYMSYGDQGEGWTSIGIVTDAGGTPATITYTFSTTQAYTSGSDGIFEILLMGRNGNPNDLIHHVELVFSDGVNPSQTVDVPPFSFHDTKKVNVPVPVALLGTGTLKVTIRNLGNASSPSRVSFGYTKFRYPQAINMLSSSEKYLHIPAVVADARLELENAPYNSVVFDVTDPDNVQRMAASFNGTGQLVTDFPASSEERNLYVLASSSYLPVPLMYKANIENFSNAANANYIIVSNTKILTGAREYAKYRATPKGGGYDTLVADVNDLYNLFSYGERTPVAIRRFLEYLTSIGNPQYLFIIGKGLSADYWGGDASDYYRKNPSFTINDPDLSERREDLVPTFGVPGSDLLFSAGLKGKPKLVPAIATGRLSAKSSAEVLGYLKKMQENDTTSKALWRKNLVHLSGGEGQDEVKAFRSYVDELKVIAEDTLFSGQVVKTFTKVDAGTVSAEFRGSVVEEVNKGISYLTFFGHSSPGGSDLDIGYVSTDFYGYRNHGQYPMLLILGCGASQMFLRYSFSEDWILTPDRGALVTLGHTDAGYVVELRTYGSLFYRNAFQKRSLLNKPVGDIHLGTINDFYNVFGSGYDVALGHIQQMVLQGDPATRLYNPELPDYETNASKISIKSLDGRTVTAVSDSFALSIAVANLGIDFKDSLEVSVRRTVNGKVTVYGPVRYNDVSYADTLLFYIKSPDVANYGENIFEVQLDPNNLVKETDELNNIAVLHYFMPLSGVVALSPSEYCIVNHDSVTLIGQSTNLLVGNVDYYLQIDTSYSFNSPLMRESVISGSSLVKWKDLKLPLLQDSTVYYWRVRYKNITPGVDTLWGESSFTYIKDSPEGWSQSRFPQFYKDGLVQLQKDIPNKEWEFEKSVTEIFLRAPGSTYTRNPPDKLFPSPGFETVLQINGSNYQVRGWCDENMLLSLAFDKNTATPYTAYTWDEGGATCGVPGRNYINIFNGLYDSTSAAGAGSQNQANLLAYIDQIPAGDYVVFLNTADAYFSNWSTTLKDKFKSAFGASLLDSLQSGMPYILVAQKGNPVPIYENYNKLTSQLIEYKGSISGTYNQGYITSTLIGPAESWGTLYRTFAFSEVPVTDKYKLKIIGADLEGRNVDTLDIAQTDTLDLSSIAALKSFSYLRLLAEVSDSVHLTPPQLEKWQVIYSGVPEGVMNPDIIGVASYNPVTTGEGDTLRYCYAFENISNYDFKDSLQVKYTITNQAKGVSTSYAMLKPLKKDSMVTFCYTFPTNGYEGTNVIQAFVNPRIQKEQYYNNNIIETTVNAIKDKIHPILDVVFDGIHIMDGDIVSPNPVITITLNDENSYLIRNNLNGIEVYLQKPGQSLPQLVQFDGSNLISAKQVGANGKNSYQIVYNPKNLPDGVYTLVVKAKDVAGNSSGTEDYSISFEVINESSITNFYPYPNPFSSSTRFVFTITGNDVPQDLKIQIMTVTGKVVREITKEEIGPIHIGNNKTEYSWDGTDEFGDKLANGVYLYRVVLKDRGNFEHRKTAGDQAFKKGFGKLYILR